MSKEKHDKNLAQAMGIARTVVRSKDETDIQLREDRIGRYFKKYLKEFVFSEFSEEYMAKAGVAHIMRGVPVPLRKQDLVEFAGGDGLKATHLAQNMAWIMGCDPKFQYTKSYVAYLSKLFNYKIYEGMLKVGRDFAEKGDLDAACIHFRATLCMQHDYLHGMYSYARACRDMYLASNNPEYVGRFKAEALDYFELTSETHPRFAQANYYLGYAYLNLGLYIKAELAWREFLRFTRNNKDRKEIQQRIAQLEVPIKIEMGYNAVLAGRYEEGLQRLEPFLNTNYNKWWPLHYYLGVCYSRLEQPEEAVDAFKKVLTLNASHLETMDELVALYEQLEDKQLEEKYAKKAKLIRDAMKKDAEKAQKEQQADEKQEAAADLESVKLQQGGSDEEADRKKRPKRLKG